MLYLLKHLKDSVVSQYKSSSRWADNFNKKLQSLDSEEQWLIWK